MEERIARLEAAVRALIELLRMELPESYVAKDMLDKIERDLQSGKDKP